VIQGHLAFVACTINTAPMLQARRHWRLYRSGTNRASWPAWFLLIPLIGCHSHPTQATLPQSIQLPTPDSFSASTAGTPRQISGIDFCWCPPGHFRMGSPPDEPERRPGEDQVDVTLTRGFWIAKYETTQSQWKRIVGPFPAPLTAGDGDDFPVYSVNFAEAREFCRRLTALARASGELPAGWEFRLPTEAQWEYACRAGTTTATSFGDSLSRAQANFQGKSYNRPDDDRPSLKRCAKVGSYPPNPWGLHDMHGNVFEWCADWSVATLPGGVDPDLSSDRSVAQLNRDGTVSRIRRGGCWADEGWPCRSAFRARFEPDRRADHIGFRVVAVAVHQ
jgi:formylglycine-generating enzyme